MNKLLSFKVFLSIRLLDFAGIRYNLSYDFYHLFGKATRISIVHEFFKGFIILVAPINSPELSKNYVS